MRALSAHLRRRPAAAAACAAPSRGPAGLSLLSSACSASGPPVFALLAMPPMPQKVAIRQLKLTLSEPDLLDPRRPRRRDCAPARPRAARDSPSRRVDRQRQQQPREHDEECRCVPPSSGGLGGGRLTSLPWLPAPARPATLLAMYRAPADIELHRGANQPSGEAEYDEGAAETIHGASGCVPLCLRRPDASRCRPPAMPARRR